MKIENTIIIYVIIGIIIALLAVVTFFPGVIYAFTDSNSDGNDICTPKPGYTPESWREHMSHHPNIYKDCL